MNALFAFINCFLYPFHLTVYRSAKKEMSERLVVIPGKFWQIKNGKESTFKDMIILVANKQYSSIYQH